MNEAPDTHLRKFIVALRATKKNICVTAANRLENLLKSPFELDLHLRRADLSEAEATNIAAALNDLSHTSGPCIRSFSISYNPNIHESGAIALINALPKTITEIGMVGCGLGDESAKALLDWARHAASLRVLCVEGNNFSPEMAQRFTDLREHTKGLSVVA